MARLLVSTRSNAPTPAPDRRALRALHARRLRLSPPFLLLPRALLLLTTDFFSQRILFSAASFLLILFACASAAKTLGGVAECRMWLLTPLFMANPVVLATLQVGNFHLVALALEHRTG